MSYCHLFPPSLVCKTQRHSLLLLNQRRRRRSPISRPLSGLLQTFYSKVSQKKERPIRDRKNGCTPECLIFPNLSCLCPLRNEDVGNYFDIFEPNFLGPIKNQEVKLNRELQILTHLFVSRRNKKKLFWPFLQMTLLTKPCFLLKHITRTVLIFSCFHFNLLVVTSFSTLEHFSSFLTK